MNKMLFGVEDRVDERRQSAGWNRWKINTAKLQIRAQSVSSCQ